MLEMTRPSETFRYDVVPERAAARVVPNGDLDLASVEILRSELDHLFESGFAHVILDLRRLDFIDSTGLSLIMVARHTADSLGVRLELVPGSPAVQRIFEVTKTASALFD